MPSRLQIGAVELNVPCVECRARVATVAPSASTRCPSTQASAYLADEQFSGTTPHHTPVPSQGRSSRAPNRFPTSHARRDAFSSRRREDWRAGDGVDDNWQAIATRGRPFAWFVAEDHRRANLRYRLLASSRGVNAAELKSQGRAASVAALCESCRAPSITMI